MSKVKWFREPPVQTAAKTHTDLTVFAAVVSLLEGGHLYTSQSQIVASKIIKLCQREQQRLLLRYDRAVADNQELIEGPF